MFVPRIAPAMKDAVCSMGDLTRVAATAFCELYSLVSSPYTSGSIAECKEITNFIITTIYRNVIDFAIFINRMMWTCLKYCTSLVFSVFAVLDA